MNECIRLIPAEQTLTTYWSGGTTTQLAIAPESALYADRAFLWRLSSAVVELDESDFTPLPDYMRYIAPLRGEMRLTHNGGEPITLAPLETHYFDGADDTHSWGRCTDFNLMLRRGVCEGGIEALRLAPGETRTLRCAPGETLLLYAVEGRLQLTTDTETRFVCERETAVLPQGVTRVTAENSAAAMTARVRKTENKGE